MRSDPQLIFVVSASLILSPMVAPTAVVAEQPTAATAFRDVLIDSQGTARLTVSDATGAPLGNQKVEIFFRDHRVAAALSNQSGTVKISGLRSGVHIVRIGAAQEICRFWSTAAAPPNATANPAFVLADDVTRGQYYGPMMGYPMQPMMGPPMVAPVLLATGVTAAAVAVVLIGKSEGDDPVVIPASP